MATAQYIPGLAALARPNRPGDVLNGPFDFDGTNGWGYGTLTDDGSVTADEFRADIYGIVKSLSGEVGAYYDFGGTPIHQIYINPTLVKV